jgi:hypothetical protein
MLNGKYGCAYNEMYADVASSDCNHLEQLIIKKIKDKPVLLSTTGWSPNSKVIGCIEIVPSHFSIISNEFIKSIMSEAAHTSDPLSLLVPSDDLRSFGGEHCYHDPLDGPPPDKWSDRIKYTRVEAYFARPIFSTAINKSNYIEYMQEYELRKEEMLEVKGLPYNAHLARLVYKNIEVVKEGIYDEILHRECRYKMNNVQNYNLMNDVCVQLRIPASCKMEKEAANMLVLFSKNFKDVSYTELVDRTKRLYGSTYDASSINDIKVKGGIIRDRVKRVGFLFTMTGQAKPSQTSEWEGHLQGLSWGQFNLGNTGYRIILGRTAEGIPMAAQVDEYAGCLKGYKNTGYFVHSKYEKIIDGPYKDEMIELVREFYSDHLYEVGSKNGYDPENTPIYRRINTPNILINIIGSASMNGKIKRDPND